MLNNAAAVFASLFLGFSPIFFLYVKNIVEVKSRKLFTAFLCYLAVYCLLFGIFIFFVDIIFASYLILLLYFFFYTFNKLKNAVCILLNTVLMLYAGLCFYDAKFVLYLPYLFYVLSVLTVFVYLVFVYHISVYCYENKKLNEEVKESNASRKIDVSVKDGERHNNVYLIIPDSYPSGKILKKYFGFDNSDFESFLEANGFVVNRNAMGNYLTTHHCLASLFNMNYIDSFFKAKENENVHIGIRRLIMLTYSGTVFQVFKKLGYKYYHLINPWENNFLDQCDIADEKINHIKSFDFEHNIFAQTAVKNQNDMLQIKLTRAAQLEILKDLSECWKYEGKKFVYSHLICPHSPFCFDEHGSLPSEHELKHSDEYHKQLYVGQIKFLNLQLKNIVSEIIQHDPQAVIIIQADHGSQAVWKELNNRDKPNSESLQERLSPFRAIYAPQGFDHNFGSSVNLFRAVFSFLTNGKIPYLEDKFYFYKHLTCFDFREINKKFLFKNDFEN